MPKIFTQTEEKLDIRRVKHIFKFSLIAESSVVKTSTVILVDDGLLRTSTGWSDPAVSLTLYADSLKDMVIATKS